MAIEISDFQGPAELIPKRKDGSAGIQQADLDLNTSSPVVCGLDDKVDSSAGADVQCVKGIILSGSSGKRRVCFLRRVSVAILYSRVHSVKY